MILLFGRNAKKRPIRREYLYCAECGGRTEHELKVTEKSLTFFFVPAFIYGEDQSAACLTCGVERDFGGKSRND